MFESEGVILDPNILMFAQQQQRAQGRTGRAKTMIFSDDRGRCERRGAAGGGGGRTASRPRALLGEGRW